MRTFSYTETYIVGYKPRSYSEHLHGQEVDQ